MTAAEKVRLLGEGVSDWIYVLSSSLGGTSSIASSEKILRKCTTSRFSQMGNKRRGGFPPLLPGFLLLHMALRTPIIQLPVSSAKLGHPAVTHSSPQTSHTHAA